MDSPFWDSFKNDVFLDHSWKVWAFVHTWFTVLNPVFRDRVHLFFYLFLLLVMKLHLLMRYSRIFIQNLFQPIVELKTSIQSPSQSVPTILVLKNRVGLWTWKKPGPKYGVQKAGCKKQGQCYSKREKARLSLLFLNNNEPVFCTLLFATYFFGPF